MAVSLALMGARGKTSEQMLRGLKLSGTNQEISEGIHRLIEPLQNSSALKVANKVYVMENYRIKPEFDAIAKVYHHQNNSRYKTMSLRICFRRNSILNQNRLILPKQRHQLEL